jgi:hypothetical protein
LERQFEQHSEIRLFQRLGIAGEEWRIIGLQQRQRRLGIQVGECSRLGKQGRWRRLGWRRPQVKATVDAP